MKPSSRDQQLGLASPLNCAAIQSGKPKTPLRRRRRGQGLDASHTAFREGRGEFSLDILFHRMSALACWRQLRTEAAVAAAPVHSRTPAGETGRNSIPMRLRDSVS